MNTSAEGDIGDTRFSRAIPQHGQPPETPLPGDSAIHSSGHLNAKDGGFLDWYVEGPGRRVAYDDLTAIDWIFEYTKERQRKRLLYASGQGLAGHARRLLDASSVWLVLITTGVLVGIIAACIDITSNWLGDLKMGYCKNGSGGGRFYLNRSFCCWGHEGKHRTWMINRSNTNAHCPDLSQCLDWTPWRKALGVSSSGGGFTVEYIFYILYSVRFPFDFVTEFFLTTYTGSFRCLCECLGQKVRHICQAQWNTGDQDHSWRLRYSTLHGSLDPGN